MASGYDDYRGRYTIRHNGHSSLRVYDTNTLTSVAKFLGLNVKKDFVPYLLAEGFCYRDPKTRICKPIKEFLDKEWFAFDFLLNRGGCFKYTVLTRHGTHVMCDKIMSL